jgi:hypothetical protein
MEDTSMANLEHVKYISLGNPTPGPVNADQAALWEAQKATGIAVDFNQFLKMEDSIVPGSFGMGGCWISNLQGGQPFQVEVAHSHTCDEILGFAGSDCTDPYALGGEIEFWLEDEQLIITRSCLVFIPAGTVHCPLYIRRVDRPIFHFGAAVDNRYEQNVKREVS